MSDLVLQLSNISKSYNTGQPNEILVFDGVELSLKRGEMVALVAPSGAGKSTLLHIAGLLDDPSSGEVAIAGQVVNNLKDAEKTAIRRDRMGFAYQFHHLLPEFSAKENVMMPQLAASTPKDEAASRAEELLSQVGLTPRMDHRPAELSGGEQQIEVHARPFLPEENFRFDGAVRGASDPFTAPGRTSAWQQSLWL